MQRKRGDDVVAARMGVVIADTIVYSSNFLISMFMAMVFVHQLLNRKAKPEPVNTVNIRKECLFILAKKT